MEASHLLQSQRHYPTAIGSLGVTDKLITPIAFGMTFFDSND